MDTNTGDKFNNGEFNRRNLERDKTRGCKMTFRYGGLVHNFNKTVGEWADDFTLESENPFIDCSCCKKPFVRSEFPYMGVFHVKGITYKYRNKFIIICKSCAYRISDIVIESGGKEVKTNRKE